ncbi:MAG: hypothetical protein WCP21_16670 [Armatimonadota bacterium]
MKNTFVVHDWRPAERLPEIIGVVDETARLCVERLGRVPHVPLTVTYIDPSTSDAFWRSPREDGLQRATGTDLLSNAVAGVVYIPEESRLVLQVDVLVQGCPCCSGRAVARSLFRHLLHTQVAWPTLAHIKTVLSENTGEAYRVLRVLGEDVEYKPEAMAAVIFAEWLDPRDGGLPIELQDGVGDQLIGLLARYEVDLDAASFYPYSWLLELGEELFSDLLEPVTSSLTTTAGGEA